MNPFHPTPHQKPKTAQPAASKEKPKDKSFVGSLDRIAAAFRAQGAQGFPSLSKAADALEAEADFLDSSRVTKRQEKEKLEKQNAEAHAALAKSDAVLADPNASREDYKKAQD